MANLQRGVNQILHIFGGAAALKPRDVVGEASKTLGKEQTNIERRLEDIYASDEANREGQEGSLAGTRYEEEELDLARRAVKLEEERADLDPTYAAKLSLEKGTRGETLAMTRLKGIERTAAEYAEMRERNARSAAFREQILSGTPSAHLLYENEGGQR